MTLISYYLISMLIICFGRCCFKNDANIRKYLIGLANVRPVTKPGATVYVKEKFFSDHETLLMGLQKNYLVARKSSVINIYGRNISSSLH